MSQNHEDPIPEHLDDFRDGIPDVTGRLRTVHFGYVLIPLLGLLGFCLALAVLIASPLTEWLTALVALLFLSFSLLFPRAVGLGSQPQSGQLRRQECSLFFGPVLGHGLRSRIRGLVLLSRRVSCSRFPSSMGASSCGWKTAPFPPPDRRGWRAGCVLGSGWIATGQSLTGLLTNCRN